MISGRLFLLPMPVSITQVVWRPVIWGYSLQFVMGMMVLQWQYGYTAVEWLSQYVAKIINFGYHGAALIYGDPFMVLHPYVMMVSYVRIDLLGLAPVRYDGKLCKN